MTAELLKNHSLGVAPPVAPSHQPEGGGVAASPLPGSCSSLLCLDVARVHCPRLGAVRVVPCAFMPVWRSAGRVDRGESSKARNRVPYTRTW